MNQIAVDVHNPPIAHGGLYGPGPDCNVIPKGAPQNMPTAILQKLGRLDEGQDAPLDRVLIVSSA